MMMNMRMVQLTGPLLEDHSWFLCTRVRCPSIGWDITIMIRMIMIFIFLSKMCWWIWFLWWSKWWFPPILAASPCVFSYDHVSVPELVINDQVMVVLRAIVKIMMILSLCFLNDCIEQPFSSSSSSHSLLAFIADHGLVCGGRVKSLPIDGVVWYVALSRKSSSPSSSYMSHCSVGNERKM